METLNLGHNALGDDGLVLLIRDGLEKNRHLLNLGLQVRFITIVFVVIKWPSWNS